MSSKLCGVLLLLSGVALLRPAHADGVIRLPNTSNVDGQLTANLGVDHFFSLWIVFNNDEVVISDEPFTILAPKNTAIIKDNGVLQQPESVKRLLSDHVVLGARIDLNSSASSSATTTSLSYQTLGGRNFTIASKEGRWRANSANVLETRQVEPNGLLVVLDDYLFPGDAKKQKTMPNKTGGDPVAAMTVITVKEESKPIRNVTFIENVMQVLSLLKSGVRVFQHFLTRSNVSKLLNDEDEYTVFVPTDHAFQRWHPIDWGFYPFSVPEFTESVIINHFVKGKLKQEGIKSEQTARTLGGKEVVFRKAPTLTVNGASVVKGDTPLPKGNIMFISEVLFVSEAVVSRLHQQHRDKETPPLLAFPWFGAQFLSHAFLALERDRRFTHITRFLNLADLAPHVSGTGYTFFVPTDTAFEEIGLDKMPDNYLSTGDGLEILLNHFVKGRLYDRDLKDNLTLTTLGNKGIDVGRRKENVTVNKAHIVESEVFVYNLGTMFYIDKVLFAKPELLPKIRRTTSTTSTTTSSSSSSIAEPPTTIRSQTTIISSYDNIDDKVNDNSAAETTAFMSTESITTPSATATTTTTTATASVEDVESVPEELTESGGSMPDVLFADAEIDNNKETRTASTPAVTDDASEQTTAHSRRTDTASTATDAYQIVSSETSRADVNGTAISTPPTTTTTSSVTVV